ncbi:MAG: bifunctional pyr operon transcriptional regulator/uracil phosphoribosyltransferase PyrR [Oscillospiraceae bacterium]
MTVKTLILDGKAMNRAIARISYEIIEHNKGVDNICIIGILSRGVEIANRIAEKIFEVENKQVEVGNLDITSYRDDKKVKNHIDQSQIDFSIENKKVILVDDVIFTGRSVRAAIDALMARGRPLKIELAVLVDRGHRDLPIRADFVGKNLPTSKDEKVKVMVSPRDGEDKVIILKEEN